jgi:hypothetical protein
MDCAVDLSGYAEKIYLSHRHGGVVVSPLLLPYCYAYICRFPAGIKMLQLNSASTYDYKP